MKNSLFALVFFLCVVSYNSEGALWCCGCGCGPPKASRVYVMDAATEIDTTPKTAAVPTTPPAPAAILISVTEEDIIMLDRAACSALGINYNKLVELRTSDESRPPTVFNLLEVATYKELIAGCLDYKAEINRTRRKLEPLAADLKEEQAALRKHLGITETEEAFLKIRRGSLSAPPKPGSDRTVSSYLDTSLRLDP